MIVNWKKEDAGILNIPCIINDENKVNTIDKYVVILPGHNDVNNKDWEAARPAALRLIKSGDLVELVEKRTTKLEGRRKIRTKFKGELDFEKNFPYNEILSVMNGLGIFKEISEIKEKETEKKNFTKAWLIEFFKDDEDGQLHWDVIQDQFKDSDNESDKEFVAITLDEMEPELARDVVLDTYSLKTLNLWLDKISQPDLRVVIMNQITAVNEPPKKK